MVSAFPRAANAEFSLKDGQVLGRVLGFSGDGFTGVAVVAIVFSPDNPDSRREAELIRTVVGDDLPTGRVRLHVRLVTVEQLASVTGINAVYVTPGLAASMETVLRAAQRLHVPTISASLACVQSGACVVGFASEPTVQIVFNQAAAERTGVHFLQAFRILVREK